MAIAVENSNSTQEETSNDNTISLAFTANSGSNRIAIVVAMSDFDTQATSHSVTYGGASPSISRAFNAAHSAFIRVTMDVFIDSEIGSGSKTIQLIANGISGVGGTALGVLVLSGVDQSTPYGGAASSAGVGNVYTATATGLGATDLVVDGWGGWDVGTPANEGANQTSVIEAQTLHPSLFMSTQLGSIDGVMSWIVNIGNEYAGGAAAFKEAGSGLAREQEGYRWRADDGDEDGATWLASQDTDISRTKDNVTRLRTLIDTTGDAPSEAVKLQYRKVGAGSWRDVPTGI